MKIIGLYHRVDNILGYQKKDGTYVAILKSPLNKINNVKIYYDDPYNWKKLGKTWKNKFWNCSYKKNWIKKEVDKFFEYYTFEINLLEKRFKYFFVFEYKNKKYSYGEFGFIKFQETNKFNYHSFSFTWNFSSIGKYIGLPEWWKKTSWYQIFPDKFYSSTNKKLITNYDDEHAKIGGNLKGIIQKLDYVKNLGFNGIYLNPIFLASSDHKYDTINYKKIDHDLGTMKDFETLIKELKKRNMKIMLDGVFNHVGSDHPFWIDVLKNKENSQYKNWFLIRNFDNLKPANEYKNFHLNKAYSTFGNTPNMPRLNWHNKDTSKYILEIIEFWTKKGIDAWRMDVADEVSFEMWRKIRTKIKKINSNIVLLGEIWYDPIIFLRGDQFDSSMNYYFRENIINNLFKNNKLNLKNFINYYIENKYKYSNEINKGLFNLVSSHDVPRITQFFNGDLIKARIAFTLLLILPGTISFYYGDEIDLDYDKKNEFKRGAFNWKYDKNNISYKLIKKLLKFRNKNIDLIIKNVELENINNKKLKLLINNKNKIIINFEKSSIIIVDNDKKEIINLKEKNNAKNNKLKK